MNTHIASPARNPFTEGGPASPSPQSLRQIPSLDGLRAVSIVLVFLGHIAGTRNAPHFLHHLEHAGNLGVKVFFAISGFLITTLLLRELAGTGRIRLSSFYARRSLRIFPAFYTYVAVITMLVGLGLIALQPGDWLHAVTYTMNYHEKRAWYLNHLWSLAVEEQFYLIWPALIVLLGPRDALRGAMASVLLAPLVRLIMWRYLDSSPTALTREFQAVADSLATGCLLAGCYHWLGTQRWYVGVASSPLFPIIPAAGVVTALATNVLGRGAYYIFGQSIANIAIVIGIDYCVRFPSSPIGRVLNTRPLVWVGILSYSLYLWQELFLNPMDTKSSYTSFPGNVCLAVLAAVASHYFVERPFLKLKSKFR
jgi:peptidoglycan/LPS O-acetylase OafA/YrhL